MRRWSRSSAWSAGPSRSASMARSVLPAGPSHAPRVTLVLANESEDPSILTVVRPLLQPVKTRASPSPLTLSVGRPGLDRKTRGGALGDRADRRPPAPEHAVERHRGGARQQDGDFVARRASGSHPPTWPSTPVVRSSVSQAVLFGELRLTGHHRRGRLGDPGEGGPGHLVGAEHRVAARRDGHDVVLEQELDLRPRDELARPPPWSRRTPCRRGWRARPAWPTPRSSTSARRCRPRSRPSMR